MSYIVRVKNSEAITFMRQGRIVIFPCNWLRHHLETLWSSGVLSSLFNCGE